ncbi:phosphate ABC transporter substrate-binding protein PstS [Glacieibacterium sp.]|uniref:phosphate ABC transporter substrate-binding protein PstS n=1 Tax=Glacieibacterium sp. TaxID=2860237 RepID=UPI003AFFD4CF
MSVQFTKGLRAALLLGVATAVSGPAFAAAITGAGATFPAPLYAKWGSAYKAATKNELNYQAIGSGAGQAQIKARTVDFGASDDAMKDADLTAAGLVQFPAVIGSEVIIVNLPGVAAGQLRLTPDIIAAIYAGKITKWNDPAIAAINKGLPLRPMPITPVYRSDSSGTTAIFTNYLTKAAKGWTLGAGKTISWPVGSGGKGNDGVAGNVKNTVGALGYVEFNYAFANKLTMTKLSNTAGKFIDPTPASFNAAAAQADWAKAPNAVVNMLALPGANTWPIVSATYILVPTKPTNAAGTSAALAFFDWSYKNGGKVAQQLGYLPLPAAAVQRVRTEWKSISGVTLPR